MSSQEDYLDQLLKNVMNGGQGQPSEDGPESVGFNGSLPEGDSHAAMDTNPTEATVEEPGMSGMPGALDGLPESGDVFGMEELPESGDVFGMEELPESEDVFGMEELPESEDVFGMEGLSEMEEGFMGTGDAVPGMPGITESVDGYDGGMPDLAEMPGVLDGLGAGLPEAEDIFGMEELPEAENVLGMEGLSEMEEGFMGTGDAVPGMPGITESVDGYDGGMPETEDMFGMEELPEAEDVFGAEGLPEAEDVFGAGGLPEAEDVFGAGGLPEAEDVFGAEGLPEVEDVFGMEELPEAEDVLGMLEMAEGSDLSDTSDGFENGGDFLGEPVEDTDLADLLKTFEDPMDTSSENSGMAGILSDDSMPGVVGAESEEDETDILTSTDVSLMSEDDIERLLAESSGMSENDAHSPEEEFQGDVVDLLKGTEDNELKEIQDLLEKSDNNEAVGDEIEALLQGAAQGSENTSASVGEDNFDGAEGEMSPKQKKAMEKKRLKEEKAAAKKAAKEAKKAEKAAKKAARKGKEAVQNGDSVQGPELSGDQNAAKAEPVDTALLDSILSEAGKIDGAETISSATGNYDVKIDDIFQDGEEDSSTTENSAAEPSSSAAADFGIDLDNLFGGGMETGGADAADLPDFVALDGNDVTGIMELAGEEEEDAKPKKKGFFSRFLEFLTEEEEEEEENENIKLSEENQEIIEELDKEKNKKDKKGKKGKKKAKKADASVEDGEEGEEGEEDKKGKKKKAKKPKKEKLPKEEEPDDPKKKLSLKKVLPIVLTCLSITGAIIIVTFASVDFSDKKAGKDAYYEGDYLTCYQNLYGKDLNESEQIMYCKSECILTIRLWIREYGMLEAEGARLEALDSLIQSVNDYPTLYEYASQWNAAGEVAQEYATILNLLYENYGLTEDQARAIAAEPDDIDYTMQINAIVQGGAYGSWNEPEPVVDVPLQDELPEETELPEGNFIDTNTSAQ